METFDYSKVRADAKLGKLDDLQIKKLIEIYTKGSWGPQLYLAREALPEQLKQMSDMALFKLLEDNKHKKLLKLVFVLHRNIQYEPQLEELMIERYSEISRSVLPPFSADTEKKFVDMTETTGSFGGNKRQSDLADYIFYHPSKRLLLCLLEAAKKCENVDKTELWAVNKCIVCLAGLKLLDDKRKHYLALLQDIELQQQILDLHNSKTSLFLLILFDYVNLPPAEIIQRFIRQKDVKALRFLLSHSLLGEYNAVVMREFPELEDEIILSELVKWVLAYPNVCNPANMFEWENWLNNENKVSPDQQYFNTSSWNLPIEYCAEMYCYGNNPENRKIILNKMQEFCKVYAYDFNLDSFTEKIRRLKESCL